MKTVLLDVDGVLADFVSAYLDIVHEVTGRVHSPADVTSWDINAALGIEGVQASNVKRAIGSAPQLARRLAVFDNAQTGVAALEAIANVYIVTSPWNSNPTWTHDREHWLERYFGIRSSRVIHTSAKHLVRGDFLVDDKTATLVMWWAHNPVGVPVQWQTPHNRTELWSGESTNSWARLAEIVGAP